MPPNNYSLIENQTFYIIDCKKLITSLDRIKTNFILFSNEFYFYMLFKFKLKGISFHLQFLF